MSLNTQGSQYLKTPGRKEGSMSLGRLVVVDVQLTTSEGWATYFQKLATPKEQDNYSMGYEQQVDLDFELMS